MAEISKEKMTDMLLDIQRRRVTPLETFNADLTEHFTSALAAYNVPKHIILELTSYAALRANILTCDVVNREFRRWENNQKRYRRNNKETYNEGWVDLSQNAGCSQKQ